MELTAGAIARKMNGGLQAVVQSLGMIKTTSLSFVSHG
jgi:hypothetical protein